ncbi:ABC transporter ATP-binding protein [Alteribacillus sp. HJP-4]|uniref:ABC transporter ATP-binding protein n=1 Tax=Alteribacillus sp. HJP-4 TaxID=2775394 RepID=UPI0035CCE1FE
MTAYIEIKNVGLNFGGESIFHSLQLEVAKYEFISVVGRTGIGKSTLLRMIAGLLTPTEGSVHFEGEAVDSPREDVTYVFQKPVLLEWRTLLENVLLPGELNGSRPSAEDRKKAEELLLFVELNGHQDKYPHECSGGMLSRAALARALFSNPRVLLMDEPFASLDSMTKEQMQMELLQIASTYQTTIIFVTHDIQEAVFLSDRVLLLGDQSENEVKQYHVSFKKPREKQLKFEPAFMELVREVHKGLEEIRGRQA